MFTAALGFYFLLKQSADLAANTQPRHMGRVYKFQDHQTSRTGQVEHGVKLITHLTVRLPSVGGFSVLAFCVSLGNSHNAYGYRWQSCHLHGCVSAYMPFFLLLPLFFFFCTDSLKKYKKLSPTEFSNSAIVFGAHELYESGC